MGDIEERVHHEAGDDETQGGPRLRLHDHAGEDDERHAGGDVHIAQWLNGSGEREADRQRAGCRQEDRRPLGESQFPDEPMRARRIVSPNLYGESGDC